jgi:DNA-binding response OmpR family regulator
MEASVSSSRKHILIADSDEQILIELERLLQDEGFETTTAWSTSATVELLTNGKFDLLLVADHPPELNCEQVLRLRRQSGAQAPLVVLETGPRHPFAEPYLITLGASSFVHKWRQGDVKNVVLGILSDGPSATKSAVAGNTNLR